MERKKMEAEPAEEEEEEVEFEVKCNNVIHMCIIYATLPL